MTYFTFRLPEPHKIVLLYDRRIKTCHLYRKKAYVVQKTTQINIKWNRYKTGGRIYFRGKSLKFMNAKKQMRLITHFEIILSKKVQI